jgi:hypothetical protein
MGNITNDEARISPPHILQGSALLRMAIIACGRIANLRFNFRILILTSEIKYLMPNLIRSRRKHWKLETKIFAVKIRPNQT